MANKDIALLLDQYAKELNTNPPKFDNQDRCKITIDAIPIYVEAPDDKPEVLLLSPVYDRPPTLEVMKEALSGNLYWLETGGGTLMWDKDYQTLLICYQFKPEHIHLQDLKNILFNFADFTRVWQERLQKVGM
jgi:hypothetical protein